MNGEEAWFHCDFIAIAALLLASGLFDVCCCCHDGVAQPLSLLTFEPASQAQPSLLVEAFQLNEKAIETTNWLLHVLLYKLE